MSTPSAPALLVLHAVRVLGYADTERVAARTGLQHDLVRELLLDDQARGHVAWRSFGGEGGWSLTESGKAHGEQLLAAELDAAGARESVREVLDGFGPINEQVARACTDWQLAEIGLAKRPVDLTQVVADLTEAAEGLASIEARLVAELTRFGGYHARFTAALHRARKEPVWITGTDRESAHKVWFELHEDLLATLGRSR